MKENRVCDRCFREKKKNEIFEAMKNECEPNASIYWDLCPECYKKFLEFLDEAKKIDR